MDPRGPERHIVAVAEILTPVTNPWYPNEDGVLLAKEVTLTCGHVTRPNPIYTDTVGDRYRCYACGQKEQHATPETL